MVVLTVESPFLSVRISEFITLTTGMMIGAEFLTRKACIFALLAICLPAALADTPGANIAGAVTDPSGSAVSGVRVEVRETHTGATRTSVTNASGAYQIPGLQPGDYQLYASDPAFEKFDRKSIGLRVGDDVRIDIPMALRGKRENVSVTAAGSLTQVESPLASTVVNQQSIQDLPSDGRQLQNLALIVPGVSAGWNLSTAANRYGKARENTEGAFNVNGARSRSNDFLFDGMPMNLRQYGVINFEPSDEAVGEFQVIAAIPSAEYGRTMGGQISIVTRSGSNSFHGAAYEFFRNDALNANDTFSKRSGLPRGTVRHNQFGGSLGGPIQKNKHFFFVNTELLRNLEESETRTSSVPSLDQRQGLISYFDGNGNPARLDFSNRITPLSTKLLALYPAPNSNVPGGNYNAALAIALSDYQYHVRTDHYFSQRDIVTLRTSWNLNDQIYVVDRFGGPYIPGFTLPNPERTTNGTLGYLHTFSPQLVNEARLGVNRYGNLLANGDQRNATEFGLPNGSSANGIPTIAFAQGGLAGLGGLPWYNREQDELTVYGSDSVSILRGSHSLKTGAEFSRYHFNTRGAENQRGSIFFDGSRNTIIPKTAANAESNVLVDLLLGLPYQATITVGQFGRGYREWAWAGFVQDRWRTSKRLTLDYGLRYEYNAPWTEVNHKLSNFFPGLGLLSERDSRWLGLYQPDRNNFAPRFGFAYDFQGTGRTVIRGGFGIYYATLLQASTVQQIENNPPFSAAAVTTAPTPFTTDGSPSTTLLDLRSSATPSRSISAIPANLRNPYSMQTSFDMQHSFGENWLTEVAYRGTRGVHLPYNYNLNQVPLDLLSTTQRMAIAAGVGSNSGTASIVDALRPYPAYNSISVFENDANSSYHSLQAKIERRFHSGLNLLSAYVWSKSMDNASDFASGDPSEQVLDSHNRRAQRALSSFDVPHRFTTAFNYSLPAIHNHSLFSGWQINGLITVQSGQPFTPYTSQFDPYRNESYNRLNVVPGSHLATPSGFAYNPANFTLPQLGTFGNSGRNIVRGDGYRSVDLSLFRTFAIRDAARLQIRFEAQNALNQVNYQGPITDQSTTPGLFVAAAPPRIVQLGAKLSF